MPSAAFNAARLCSTLIIIILCDCYIIPLIFHARFPQHRHQHTPKFKMAVASRFNVPACSFCSPSPVFVRQKKPGHHIILWPEPWAVLVVCFIHIKHRVLRHENRFHQRNFDISDTEFLCDGLPGTNSRQDFPAHFRCASIA